MAKVESYLDQVCARLRVNPAEAEDVREELQSHINELIEAYRAGGIDYQEATDLALAWFGDARKLHDHLDVVHQGDSWWVSRLKGLALGMLIGGVLAILIPFGGHMEFVNRLFAIPAGFDASRIHIMINALIVGGVIGSLSANGRGMLVGWSMGSFIWFIEYVIYWIIIVTGGPQGPDANIGLLNSVLMAPLLGGVFGAIVGFASASALTMTSRARPQIR